MSELRSRPRLGKTSFPVTHTQGELSGKEKNTGTKHSVWDAHLPSLAAEGKRTAANWSTGHMDRLAVTYALIALLVVAVAYLWRFGV